jgi:hypothetical protein
MSTRIPLHGITRFRIDRPELWLARGLLILWAGFWLWFNIASAIGESDGAWWHIGVAAATLALFLASWFWPKVGGVLMVAAGMFAARAFGHTAALTILAIPAATIGVILLLVRRPSA